MPPARAPRAFACADPPARGEPGGEGPGELMVLRLPEEQHHEEHHHEEHQIDIARLSIAHGPEVAPPPAPPDHSKRHGERDREHSSAKRSITKHEALDSHTNFRSLMASELGKPSEICNQWVAFFRTANALPVSCRYFLKWSFLCFGVILVNAIMVLLGILTIPANSDSKDQQVQMLVYYGMSQIVFALRKRRGLPDTHILACAIPAPPAPPPPLAESAPPVAHLNWQADSTLR